MMDVGLPLPKRIFQLATISLLLIPASFCWAQDTSTGSDFKMTGFISVTGGKILNGSLDANYDGPAQIDGNNCPCYTADWSNAGVYTKSFSLKPESRIGIQATYKPNANTSFVGQLVSRGTDGTPNLQWAYGGYKLDKHWEIQVGRKRVPLYYYSDFQDIGLSYPWVSTPPELYGWEVTNYNGASLRYNNNFGDNNLTASLFTGSEKVKDSLYQKLYYTGKTEVSWKRLIGGDIEVNNGPLTARAVYMQADARAQIFDLSIDDTAALKAYGFAFNLDVDQWFILSELTQLSRNFKQNQYTVTAPAMTLGAGWRLGAWTPFINFAKYTEKSNDHSQYLPQSYKRTSFTVRYDMGSSSAIKAQLDRNTDVTNNFGGNNTLFRISYDRVF
ncbi:MAG: hypothetical protein Q7U12_12380 [Undibacterium sp.]|nr:hypothetical protein [Undibacterium sp.]